MRLADFIVGNMESIMANWEQFAGTLLPAAQSMCTLELRDHAPQILEAIAADLRTPQSREEQSAKSKGMAPTPFPARETAAQTHAVLRARAGFDIRQLVAEYRALRASVLSLWADAVAPATPDLEDMIRFNEAIDQALAESVGHFSAQVEQSRNLLLGMLSHDMRTPLQAIQTTATYLRRHNAGEAVWAAAQRLIDSGERVQSLLDDLTDFNRSNLGLGIPITRSRIDLAQVCAEEVNELRAAHPDHRFDLIVDGDCHGIWDGRRVQQIIGNLAVNAVKHGAADAPVRIFVTSDADDVRIDVRNGGAPIPPPTRDHMFEPLTRGSGTEPGTGLGLGLYIVREIAKAHGGNVRVQTGGGETVFTVRLPRSGQPDAAHHPA